MFSSKYYRSSPVVFQEALINGRALARKTLREGRSFRRVLAELLAVQRQNERALEEYQDRRLKKLLSHAVSTVPFYQEQVDLARVRSLPPREALLLFPLIDKEVVRSAGDSFLSSSAGRPLVTGATSGTTGSPLRIKQDLASVNRENAFIHRQLEWAGFRRGHRRAWIRGDLVVDGAVSRPPYWRRNLVESMLMMSSFHLSVESAPLYLEALNRHNPRIIQAYPSSIGFLATYLRSVGQRYKGDSLHGIVTSSESLDPDLRNEIELAFGCPVFDWYGQFERVAAIGTCEYGRHHLISDYSFVELVPRDGGQYEIIGTGFNNQAMPLIRYRTGDTLEVAGQGEACECGRHFPRVQRIHGRDDDCIKLPDGRKVGRLDRVFNGASGVIEGQIVQERLGIVQILVVPGQAYSVSDESALVEALRARVGNELEIDIQKVSALTRTRSGKVRNVICTL